MTNKPAKPEAKLPDELDAPLTPEEEARLDAWEERNKDALNASIREARARFARGEYRTHEEVWARLRAILREYKD